MTFPFFLASASPRRQKLLCEAGFDFDIHPAEIHEERNPQEPPQAYADRLAREKAEAVARSHAGAWVLGADTIVVADPGAEAEAILGKPETTAEAMRMLARLSGARHQVVTAVALARLTETGLECDSFSSTANVYFRSLSEDEIWVYVATGEPMDKAGAYAIQGGAAGFVECYEGSWSAIVGLPMEETIRELRERGITPT